MRPNPDGRLWWCNTHRRRATHLLTYPYQNSREKPHCDPVLGGILLPCCCVDLTDEVELEEVA